MAKVMIGINVLESVNSFVYQSHIRFFSNLKKDFPEDQFYLFTPYRMSIDSMRNISAKMAIDSQCDYLMFIDDDVIIQPETYKELKAADKDIIMALTYIRGYPFRPMMFKTIEVITDIEGKVRENLVPYEDFKKDVDPETGLLKCQAVGFSCVLIKMDVVKAVAPPYFITSSTYTEDVYFCNKARYTLEPEPSIYVHTKVPTMHMMMADGVNDDNVEKLRELYAPTEPIGKSRYDRILDAVKVLSE